MKPSKRYYLHSKVKKAGFKVDGYGRTVYVDFGEEGGGITEPLHSPIAEDRV